MLKVCTFIYDLFFVLFSESELTHEISSLKTTAARLKFKGIDGGLHKRWSMWFNSKQRADPYQSLQYTENNGYALYFGIQALHGCRQFVAWAVGLSPRTNATLLTSVYFDTIPFHTASDIREEGEDDVKSAWPLWVGLHTCYNGNDKRRQHGNIEQIPKSFLSSDCSLQLENMKLESLVIVDQHATVNLYLSLVHTARHTLKIFMPWSKRSSPRTHSAIKKKHLPFFFCVFVGTFSRVREVIGVKS